MRKKLLIIFLVVSMVASSCSSGNTFEDYLQGNNWLTAEERLYGLSFIWRKVAEMSPFLAKQPDDFCWDEHYMEYIPKVLNANDMVEYYEILRRFIAHLGDGKSNVQVPNGLTTYAFPITVRYIDGSYIVFSVHQDFSNIPIGSEIISINGVDAGEFLESNFGDMLGNHTPNVRENSLAQNLTFSFSRKVVNLEALTPDSETIIEYIGLNPFSYEMLHAFEEMETLNIQPIVEGISIEMGAVAYVYDGDIHHIAISTFRNAALPEAVRSYIESVASTANGFILDVRGNVGGTSDLSILSQFIDPRELNEGISYRQVRDVGAMMLGAHATNTELLEMMELELPTDFFERTIHGYTVEEGLNMLESRHLETLYDYGELELLDLDLLYEQSLRLFDIPVVILVDYTTASAAESFVLAAQGTGNFTTMGTNTMGMAGDFNLFMLPGGGFLMLNVIKQLTPSGQIINNNGVAPDVWVQLSLSDYLDGVDAQLMAALEYLD